LLGGYTYSIQVASDGQVWTGGSEEPGGAASASPAKLPNTPNVAFAQSIDFTKGPNGHIWGLLAYLSSGYVPVLFEFSPTGDVLNSYPLPQGSQISGDHALIAGADGALWFADSGTNAIGRMTASGQLHEYPIPTANSGVMNIALAPDGGMWFTEANANKIGRIDTSGNIYEFNVPTANAGLSAIAAPPSPSSCNPSQVWFTETNANKIASITY
jgi:virginiamycin B lyase